MLADAALDGLDSPAARREGVRTTRRELKAVRAIAPLCRDAGPSHGSTDGPTDGSTAGSTAGATIGARNGAIDGVLEFSTKTNQLLGPLRDRDTLLRSIHRIVERFADADTRRVARTVLVATLIFSESNRRDEAAYSAASIDRARRSMRSARAAMASLGAAPAFDRRCFCAISEPAALNSTQRCAQAILGAYTNAASGRPFLLSLCARLRTKSPPMCAVCARGPSGWCRRSAKIETSRCLMWNCAWRARNLRDRRWHRRSTMRCGLHGLSRSLALRTPPLHSCVSAAAASSAGLPRSSASERRSIARIVTARRILPA